jgi:UDP-N-acetylmuramate dehydrogenase
MERTLPLTIVSPLETPTLHALATHTTLRLGGTARGFVVAGTDAELVAAVTAADAAGEPVLLLGGGSNLVVGDGGFDGTVIRIATTGYELTRRADGSRVQVDVAAGQNWDEFVAALVAEGIGGLECLSGIPGSVGATPIQNVGAYGCEVAETCASVELLDRRTGEVGRMAAAELGFAYRTSVLKGTDTGVVLSVRFTLTADGLSAPIRYAELARALGVEVGARVPVAEARAAVLRLRRGKGMVLDAADHDTWSAGSFFTNPIVPEAAVAGVLARIAEVLGDDIAVPQYPATGGVKLSAAWLIERAGFAKGHSGPGGRVALSSKHTLALTNRGSASTQDLLALAREVRDGVRDRFGVELHPEPLLINCSL